MRKKWFDPALTGHHWKFRNTLFWDTLLYIYQLFSWQPPALSDALYLATRGSAQLLEKEGELGLLEGGALADILLVDMQGGWNSFALSDWQDGIPQVTRTRSCLDTSRQRTWCTSSSSSQTTGTLRAFGWTVGKSRIHWMQSSHSDRNLKMMHFLWKKTHFSWKKIHFSWTIKIPIFSFIGTLKIWAFSIEPFLVFQGIHEYIVKSK